MPKNVKEPTESPLPFRQANYWWLGASIVLIVIGFWVMSLEQAPHGLGFLGLTLGPVLVLGGFGLVFVALFKSN